MGFQDIAVKIVTALIDGIENQWPGFKAKMVELLNQLPQFVKDFFGISSPSKMFKGFGENLMEGFAQGIQDAIELPKGAMSMAVTHLIQPAMASVPVGQQVSTTITNNFSQTVNTGAQQSTVIADFRTMQAMSGIGSGV